MAKDRSPNYPAYDLASAVDFVRRIYKAEGKSSALPKVMVGALGYAGLSGSARQKLASMRQYGLLEDAPDDKVRLSPRAVHLANLTPADADFSGVAREALLTPPLFREFQDKYPEASDRNLELDLITAKHFQPDGARRVIKSYRDSVEFAKAGARGYNGAEGGANGDDREADEAGGGPPKDREQRKRREQTLEASSTVTYSWPLDDAEKVEVTFVGNPGKKPTRRDLDALIETLEGIRKRTPEPEPPEPRSARERERIAEVDGGE
jgi:hypothetical protein